MLFMQVRATARADLMMIFARRTGREGVARLYSRNPSACTIMPRRDGGNSGQGPSLWDDQVTIHISSLTAAAGVVPEDTSNLPYLFWGPDRWLSRG
ncbi:hypothetical protein CSAL01_01178 [Colletotrichum salicis]|uniref:Uncharacterized protein n=1 Tax=Colletotrichum salicis TaxID=1209931 RepID=A0A135SLL4_9PEZI|nr:hypothetical protein CSAL01_01178 [Colletotrichum salicis]